MILNILVQKLFILLHCIILIMVTYYCLWPWADVLAGAINVYLWFGWVFVAACDIVLVIGAHLKVFDRRLIKLGGLMTLVVILSLIIAMIVPPVVNLRESAVLEAQKRYGGNCAADDEGRFILIQCDVSKDTTHPFYLDIVATRGMFPWSKWKFEVR